MPTPYAKNDAVKRLRGRRRLASLLAFAAVATSALRPAGAAGSGVDETAQLRLACGSIAAATAMRVDRVAVDTTWGMCAQSNRYARGESVWREDQGRWTFVDGSPDPYKPSDAAGAHARYPISVGVFTRLVNTLHAKPPHGSAKARR